MKRRSQLSMLRKVFISSKSITETPERQRRIPGNIYLFTVNNRITRQRCEICLKLTIKIPEQRHRRQWRLLFYTFFSVYIVDFELVTVTCVVLYCQLWTVFKHCSDVSIADLDKSSSWEQVNYLRKKPPLNELRDGLFRNEKKCIHRKT